MSGGDWSNDRLETSDAEARHVVDAQRSTMADIDAKAISTVRITVLLTGIAVAAARIGGPSLFHPLLFKVGVVLLTFSTVAGIHGHRIEPVPRPQPGVRPRPRSQ